MIGIINYGCNNLQAIQNNLESLNMKYDIIDENTKNVNYDKYILPGVSAFDSSITNLKKLKIFDEILDEIINKKKLLLGICAGMHLLGKSSEEGSEQGLDLIPEKVVKIKEKNKLPVPHMGWNTINIKKDNPLTKDISNGSYFYFCHSYKYSKIDDSYNIATTDYEDVFCSIINKENIFGVQFHPEKSHDNGQKIFLNFKKM